jgi:serine/threonine protein phosphatase 1
MRTFVIGDIHGCYNQLSEVIKLAQITREDRLVFLGDYVDRGPDTYSVIEYLIWLSKNHECVFLKGNHDDAWHKAILSEEISNSIMWKQGAQKTFESYFTAGVDPSVHLDFFDELLPYFVDENLNCYVHGGFNRHILIEQQEPDDIYWWDRDLLHSARSYSMLSKESQQYKFKIKGCNEGKFKEIFVGHTPVQFLTPTLKLSNGAEGLLLESAELISIPQKYANIWAVDTGAGKYVDGKVTIMNVETKEYFQA